MTHRCNGIEECSDGIDEEACPEPEVSSPPPSSTEGWHERPHQPHQTYPFVKQPLVSFIWILLYFFGLWHYFIGISSDAQSTNVQMKTFASVQRNVATAGGSVAMATMNTVAHVSSSPSSFVWKMIENRFSLQFAEPETRCGADEFKCDEHICLPNSKKCDRNRDCRDGTDESDCRKYFSGKKVKFANFVCSMKSVTKNNVFEATDYRTKNGFFSLKMLLL